ncbi:Viral membrane associated early morphogenesis protein [NY_014 poxvirus]|uniref:Viral membrane associated early morphogenesis protein n=1 Tax=NY_014 poxvirus TaxID=2025360 RepID=UPI000B99F532|nr:Viral membrane associated early morphogenesis protein [NY_014 poxvirus]AST09521.1 Viral membrane associated early morphogenesis protein [NY_014 poxvirus]
MSSSSSCYITILKSIGGLALFQVANGAIDLFRHFFMYFCEHKLRHNSFWFVIIRSIAGMIMYLVLGIILLYISEKKNDNDISKESTSR